MFGKKFLLAHLFFFADFRMRRTSLVAPALQKRSQNALKELDRLLADAKDFPINYNHYYTDTVHMKRQQRMLEQLEGFAPEVVTPDEWEKTSPKDVIESAVDNWGNCTTADMEDFSCEEALDCLLAIYEVSTIMYPCFNVSYLLTNISIGPTENFHRQYNDPGHRATHRPRFA